MGILQSKKKIDLITCGLDNSGKTTIINHLKPQKQRVDDTTPTIGYVVETFTKGKVNFKVFDMGGAKKFRDLWSHHFRDVEGVLFVIDCADKLRICLVKNELELLLENKELKGTPILFFANKMDIPGALMPPEVAEQLELAELCADRPYNIVASNALVGTGVEDGIKWLSDAVLKTDA
eukprot:NODE_3692_length_862_cov_189.975510_g3456_i1.p1 GENE.NODE_3692_length_862_cov_189.975510_g3456_i1~~NODE_3692_length_862_cov_189.975510_g3456_i1.p1  ORF type:complete len:208 (-),score=57.55 NODE_3692_length_862_cov_189.975510_g3456_i1:239-772(-)